MSHRSIEINSLGRLVLAARMVGVLGLSLVLWLALGWGLVGASRPVGPTGVDGAASGEVAYGPALLGPCDRTVTNDHNSGAGSLRQAIADACAGGRITFAGDYTIYLTTTLSINKRLVVDGEAHAITVSGDSAGDGTPNVRVFSVGGSGVATLTHLSIVSGSASIGTDDCVDDCGGAIYNDGTLTVQNSTLSGNSAIYDGGAIYNLGMLTVQNSTFSHNSAEWEGGGGIFNEEDGTLVVWNSVFSNNSAYAWGGGICSFDRLMVYTSTFSGNEAQSGGGIYGYEGVLTVQNSTFSGNHVSSGGGGIGNDGTLTVQDSVFSSNEAGYGGGICNGNEYENAVLTVENSTFSGNSVEWGDGGGIDNEGGTLTVRNSTFSGNSADYGGGIDNESTLNLYNTLIGNSPDGGDCRGSVAANSHNLIAGTGFDACDLTDGAGGSLIGVDPLLGPLGNYGGDTPTMPLLLGSPAINAGAACLAADQRGIARPQGPACDIGAFESRGFGLVISGGDGQSALIDTAFAQPLSVTFSSVDGAPVEAGMVITFTAPGEGAGLASSVLTATTDAGGAAGVTATANGLVGSYTVTATATGVMTPATFHLANKGPNAIMAVLGNGQVIADGDAAPSIADSTDFGGVPMGQAVTHTFIISNDGIEDLTLTGEPLVAFDGPAALDFSLVASPTTPLASVHTTTFQICFTPSVTSSRVATLTIANDDPDRNPYDFAIRGMGTDEQYTFLPVIMWSAR
jgi:hypothetical protein